MSNCYTHTCFVLVVTAPEAALIRQSIEFCNAISDEDDETIADLWAQQTPEFQAVYPATGDTPASGFLALFGGPQFPHFDIDLTYEDRDDGRVEVEGQSSEFSPENVAAMLARCVTTSLPIGVTWCDDSDKYLPGHFGGGGFHINADGIHWISPYLVNHPKNFEARYVLSVNTNEGGLQFWNEGEGFGPLENATVVPDSQREAISLPTALSQPRWIILPRMKK